MNDLPERIHKWLCEDVLPSYGVAPDVPKNDVELLGSIRAVLSATPDTREAAKCPRIPAEMWSPLWEKYHSELDLEIGVCLTEPVCPESKVTVENTGEIIAGPFVGDTIDEVVEKAMQAIVALITPPVTDTPSAIATTDTKE